MIRRLETGTALRVSPSLSVSPGTQPPIYRKYLLSSRNSPEKEETPFTETH
jgi:hypothetical protein